MEKNMKKLTRYLKLSLIMFILVIAGCNTGSKEVNRTQPDNPNTKAEMEIYTTSTKTLNKIPSTGDPSWKKAERNKTDTKLFTANNAETAILAIEFKPAALFKEIEVYNRSTLRKAVKATSADGRWLVRSQYLCAGENVFTLKITNNKDETADYELTVQYTPAKPAAQPTQEIFQGYLCPYPGKEEALWVIIGRGNCHYCGKVIADAQTFLNKYKAKYPAFRIVALTEGDQSLNKEWLEKLKKGNVEYSSYYTVQNPVMALETEPGAVPRSFFVYEGKNVASIPGAIPENLWNSHLKQHFKFEE